MDRELAPELVAQTRRKSWLIGTALCIGLIAGILWFKTLLNTSVEASKIRTAVAQTGFVENTITATGEVIPAYEQIITSPIRASIRRVLLTPGTRVRPGQPILELDKSLTQIEYEKIADQLALKQNSIEQLRLKLNKNLFDADVNDQIKSLSINKLKAELNDAKRLLKVGGQTPEDVTRAENLLQIAQLEKRQLENDLTYNRQSMSASLKESELQAQIEATNLKVLAHKLKQADILTDRAGVLTWVNEHIGSAVSEGEMLARLADLGSFRVEGSCSDVYAEQLKSGLPVIVKINETSIRGQIVQVKPAVQNGVIQFAVDLDDNRHTSLRPNQKVEVFIVTNRVAKSVRVANGPAFKGKRKQFIYVMTSPTVATRREIEVGLSNFDWVEIKSGLQPGDQVILTDLSEFAHLEQLTIDPKKP
ncbi:MULTISPECIES: efflux RND transporter periplasmic adaptor subunit [Spirosoma]|uniref:HlyD family efflux transporter periplasmic adaptor subunit n=1 Tax=Spirosoma liriopis TaxID=2937440 RepID=A0ABT0HIQ2_9BACT|nr:MULTISPECIES: HlyD family efflux transporter periplasmic adaptor subunit [Spirosoma]MCK8492034.1 HlyD family efflux transporter periplasmic adaptor subunit [Spirosoma liriopis]UHG91455.1 HlyD family efflux transporter periplasmic adaptor subunit [Spirosoma oryzicola]